MIPSSGNGNSNSSQKLFENNFISDYQEEKNKNHDEIADFQKQLLFDDLSERNNRIIKMNELLEEKEKEKTALEKLTNMI